MVGCLEKTKNTVLYGFLLTTFSISISISKPIFGYSAKKAREIRRKEKEERKKKSRKNGRLSKKIGIGIPKLVETCIEYLEKHGLFRFLCEAITIS